MYGYVWEERGLIGMCVGARVEYGILLPAAAFQVITANAFVVVSFGRY